MTAPNDMPGAGQAAGLLLFEGSPFCHGLPGEERAGPLPEETARQL